MPSEVKTCFQGFIFVFDLQHVDYNVSGCGSPCSYFTWISLIPCFSQIWNSFSHYLFEYFSGPFSLFFWSSCLLMSLMGFHISLSLFSLFFRLHNFYLSSRLLIHSSASFKSILRPYCEFFTSVIYFSPFRGIDCSMVWSNWCGPFDRGRVLPGCEVYSDPLLVGT